MSSFKEKVKQLDEVAYNEIYAQYDQAISTEHGSGDHWTAPEAISPATIADLKQEIEDLRNYQNRQIDELLKLANGQ